ncbi:fimbrial protein [Burkholderia cenocepacia]|uniref:fimbrial protein n=1 Tax=Burkholderia cenocepacia TaxID=95486 RepID=UPI0021AB6876|nr:fimbrial protein [Burkholderia cenocepacia]
MKLLVMCAVAVATSIPVSALAECYVEEDYPSQQKVPYQKVEFPAFQPAAFDPEVPDGTVLYTGKGTGSGKSGTAYCPDANGIKLPIGNRIYRGIGAYNANYHTYPTPVAGVGYRIKGGINPNQWWPNQDYMPSTGGPLSSSSGFTIELVKTGPITAAGSLSGEIGQTYYPDHGSVVRRLFLTGGLPIVPSVPTCTVQNKVIGVPLGSVSTKALETGGASDYKSFSINLRCSNGTAGTSTRMYITLTDAARPGNRSGLLTLASSGSNAAAGVGVEIRRANDTIVSFGPDSPASGNPNQWFVGQYGNTSVSIPLKARYLRGAGPLKGGLANAAATFTMSYQ